MPFDLAESFVLAAEQELGATLPRSYRESILEQNGGTIETEDDTWVVFPVADTSDRKRLSRTANHIVKETAISRGWGGFPEEALAIASNEVGDRLVLLKQGNAYQSAVYVWSHESRSLKKVANDFAEFKAL